MRVYKRFFWAALVIWCSAMGLHAAWLDQAFRQRIAEARSIAQRAADTDRCRVFLLGSSGVLFGLSAGDIERATGCAAANASGGLFGRRFADYLPEILDAVKPGDIVVLSDRCWTGVTIEVNPCFADPRLVDWFTEIRMVPNLVADLRSRPADPPAAPRMRNDAGDLLVFPPMKPQKVVVTELNGERLAAAADLLRGQAALIKAKGAVPIFAAQPLLVAHAQAADIKAQLAGWTRLMQAAAGPDTWLGPWIDSDAALFTEEGQHPSESGRARWTQSLIPAIRAALARTAHR